MGYTITNKGGEELIGWKEPSNYQQDKSSLKAGLIMIGVSIISIVVLLFTSLEQKEALITLAAVFGVFVTYVNLCYYLGGDRMSLKENVIAQQEGKYVGYSVYEDIETCTVTREKFPSASFFQLEFKLKEQKSSMFQRPIDSPSLLPSNVDLDSVLDILRSKGIKIVEDYVK